MNKTNRVKRWLCIVLAVMMLLPVIPAVQAQAAERTAAPAYHGNSTYYAVYGTIFRLDAKSGTAKKVKEIKKAFTVSDISYYNGYLYFAANFYYGTDGSNGYVCRMKADGTGFQKLARGYSPVIYDRKIYYVKTKHVVSPDNEYDDPVGIASMSLTGKNSKVLEKMGKNAYGPWSIAMADGKIFYITWSEARGENFFKAYDIKKGTSETVIRSSNRLELSDCDSSYVYLCTEDGKKSIALVYEIKTGKQYKKTLPDDVTMAGGRDGILYFSRYETNATYAYDAKRGSVKTVLKNRRVEDITFSKSGYQVVRTALSQKEFEASGYKYDMAIARMKLDGSGYKTLKKYYVS